MMHCQTCMMHMDKAPCPPPDVYVDMFYAVARNNNLPQNIADQIRWRCNVKEAPTTDTSTITTSIAATTTTTEHHTTSFAGSQEKVYADVGLIVGIGVAIVAALVFVAVVMCLCKR